MKLDNLSRFANFAKLAIIQAWTQSQILLPLVQVLLHRNSQDEMNCVKRFAWHLHAFDKADPRKAS